MEIPPQVTQWVERTYKKPRIDPEWLSGCYTWAVTTGGQDPDVDLEGLLQTVEYQILESNFSDSMLPGTGLPTHVAVPTATTILKGVEVLVEVASITEIASSAFSLNQTRMAREERMISGAVDEDGEGDIEVDEGPMPKYSRGMLKFQLTDGTTTLPAIEYRTIPELSLENTPLGYKILLKDVPIRRGIAFLEPKHVVLMGHKTDDRDEFRQANFARGLRLRMRLPESEHPILNDNNAPTPIQNVQMAQEAQLRSPLRDISPPPSASFGSNDDGDLEPRRRRLPTRAPDSVIAPAPSSSLSSTDMKTVTTSSYFSTTGASKLHPSIAPSAETCDSQGMVGIDIALSQPRRTRAVPIKYPSSDPDDEHFWSNDEIPEGIDNVTPTNHSSATRKVGVASTLSGQGKGDNPRSSHHRRSSSDFGEDIMDLDPDFLAGLDDAEREGYRRTEAVPPISSETHTSSTLSSSGQLARGKQLDTGRNIVIDTEVITIDDEEDKENDPIPTRHVRRRTELGAGGSQRSIPNSDVIELSDSD